MVNRITCVRRCVTISGGFVSDNIWCGAKVCRVAATSIADYLVHAWNHRNACKHSGAVLPPPSAPVGRWADGDFAMASLVT
jgi:hypothetical protein